MHHGKSRGKGFFQELRGEVHKFPLQKASTAKRLEQSAEAFLSTSNMVKSLGGRDSAPDPAGGSLQRSSDPLAGGKWAGCPPPQQSHPRSRPFRAPTSWPSATLFTPLSSNPEYAPAKPLELSVLTVYIHSSDSGKSCFKQKNAWS